MCSTPPRSRPGRRRDLDGTGLAAVLAAGAAGARPGTAFVACLESLVSDADRSALVGATGTGTVLTRTFDIAQGYPWPDHHPERVLRNGFWEQWHGREVQLRADPAVIAASRADHAGSDSGPTCVDAGQGVGAVTRIRTAPEVVSDLCTGAAHLLGRWATPRDSGEVDR